MPKRRAARGRGRGGKANASKKAKQEDPDASIISTLASDKDDEIAEVVEECETNEVKKDEGNCVSQDIEAEGNDAKAVPDTVKDSGSPSQENAETISESDGKADDIKNKEDQEKPENVENKDNETKCLENADSEISPTIPSGTVEVGDLESVENKGVEPLAVSEKMDNSDCSISKTSDSPQAVTKENELSEKEKQSNSEQEEQKDGNANDSLDSKEVSNPADQPFYEQIEEAEEMYVDREVDEDVQYIDEEIEEDGDQDLVDVMEMGDKENLKTSNKKVSARGTKSFVQRTSFTNTDGSKPKQGGVADTTFEEISDGSMDPMEQEGAIEAISDSEMLLDSSQEAEEEKKIIKVGKNKNAASPFIIIDEDEEDETLADIFEVAANDDPNVAVQDNDDISDASLCDEEEKNDLSLEEISDDDLESSKRKNLNTSIQIINSADKEVEKSFEDTSGTKTVPEAAVDDSSAKDDSKDEESKIHSNDNVEKSGTEEQQTSTESNDPPTDQNQKEILEKTLPSPPTDAEKDTAQQLTVVNSSAQSTEESSSKSSQKPATSVSLSTAVNVTNVPAQQSVSSGRKNGPEFLYSLHTSNKAPIQEPHTHAQPSSSRRRGKIVQCCINRIGSGNTTLLDGAKKEHREAKIKDEVCNLFDTYKSHLPSSVQDIFLPMATSCTFYEGTYSLSLGPVTSSDFKNDQFRDICFNSADRFNINFNCKMQGFLEAQFSKHKEVNRVIHNLKCLDLGIRYLVLSLRYRHAQIESNQNWHAILVFTYNQDDSQMKTWGDTNDGKVRSRLAVSGVPQGISKDFVQLLFPEALYISTGISQGNGRALTLGFSSTKTTKDISSTYELLLFNGQKAEISSMDPATSDATDEDPGKKATGFVEEDGAVIVEDVEEEDGMAVSTVREDKEEGLIRGQTDITSGVDGGNEDKDREENGGDGKTGMDPMTLTDGGTILEGKNEELSKNDESSMEKNNDADNKDGEKEKEVDTDKMVEGQNENSEGEQDDDGTDGEVMGVENVGKINESLTSQEEMETGATNKEESELDRKTEKDQIAQEVGDANATGAEDSQTSAGHEEDGNLSQAEGEMTKQNSGVEVVASGNDAQTVECGLGVEADKVGKTPVDTAKDTGESEVLNEKNANASTETPKVSVEENEKSPEDVSSKDKLNEKDQISGDKQEKAEGAQEKDENLEDVSDDEMVGAGDTSKPVESDDDVIILKEEPSKKVVANIDLTVEDSPSKGNSSQVQEETDIKKEIKLEDLVDDDVLTMTDGGFEIRLESIDLEEEDMEPKSEKSSSDNYGNYRGKYYNSNLIQNLTNSFEKKKNSIEQQMQPDHFLQRFRVSAEKPHDSIYVRRDTSQPVPAKESTPTRRDKKDIRRSQSPSPRRDVSERVSDPAHYHRHHHSNTTLPPYSSSTNYGSTNQPSRSSYNKSSYRDHRESPPPPSSRQLHQPQSSSSSYYDYNKHSNRPSDDYKHSGRPSDDYTTASRARQSGNSSKYESSSGWRDEYRSTHQHKTQPTQARPSGKNRSFSPLSVSSAELITSPPAKKYKRVSHSPISDSSRSLSPISKSPSPPLEYYSRSKTKYSSGGDKYRAASPTPKSYKDKDKYSPISARDFDTGRTHRRSRSRSPYKSWDREKADRRSRSPQYRSRRSPSPTRDKLHSASYDKKPSSSSVYRSSHAEPSSRPDESSGKRTTTRGDIISGISKYETLIKALYESKKKVSAAAAIASASFSSSAAKPKHKETSSIRSSDDNSSRRKPSHNQSASSHYDQYEHQTSSSSKPPQPYKPAPSSLNKTTSSQQQQHHQHQPPSHLMQTQNYPSPSAQQQQSMNAAAAPANYSQMSHPQHSQSMYYPAHPNQTATGAMYNQYNMGSMNPAAYQQQAYGQQQQQQQQAAMNNTMMYSYMQSAHTTTNSQSNAHYNQYGPYTNSQPPSHHQQQQQSMMRQHQPGVPNSSGGGKQGGGGGGDKQQKHWSMGDGANALMFQRILSANTKGTKK